MQAWLKMLKSLMFHHHSFPQTIDGMHKGWKCRLVAVVRDSDGILQPVYEHRTANEKHAWVRMPRVPGVRSYYDDFASPN